MIGNELKAYDGLTSRQQLNLFRNLYYNDGNATEYGIIANAINDCFAADVVPKSEDDWNSIPVDVSEALKQRAVEKAKAEVAREIFEEIESVCLKHIDRYDRYLMCCKNFAELKKKYTEGEK